MTATKPGKAMDGVHVNGRVAFCHVVRQLFECRAIPRPECAVSSSKHGR